MPNKYIRMTGSSLAAICQNAGFSDQTVCHWRKIGHRFVEVSQASVDDALARSKRGPDDHIGRCVVVL